MAKIKILKVFKNPHWFEEIKNGYKTVEYLSATTFWNKKLSKTYNHIEFTKGTTAEGEKMTFEIKNINKETGYNAILRATGFYAIELGARVK